MYSILCTRTLDFHKIKLKFFPQNFCHSTSKFHQVSLNAFNETLLFIRISKILIILGRQFKEI